MDQAQNPSLGEDRHLKYERTKMVSQDKFSCILKMNFETCHHPLRSNTKRVFQWGAVNKHASLISARSNAHALITTVKARAHVRKARAFLQCECVCVCVCVCVRAC